MNNTLLTDFYLHAGLLFSCCGLRVCDTTFIPLQMFARRTFHVYTTKKTDPIPHLLPSLGNNREYYGNLVKLQMTILEGFFFLR